MFKTNQKSYPNLLVQKAYESDPRLQKIYNTIQEVTEEFPHVKRLYDAHVVFTDHDSHRIAFRLQAIQIDVNDGQFTFIGFVFI